MTKTFALVDCNNFYVSCERVFNPALQHRPVVVLSNNDGCIIARSNEAKRLGIPMGAPYHQEKRMMKNNNVKVFSSNYQFYGDMSHRVMDSLHMFVPHMEVYSIDEAFLRLDDVKSSDVVSMAVNMRAKIHQWTGIPTSFGIAPTKTLAKIANHVAKKQTSIGVFDMRDTDLQRQIMDTLPVEELWGVSHKWGKKLRAVGITTAAQLRDAEAKFIRKRFSVVGERIVYELRGVSCIDLESATSKKNIMCSKSFGTLLTKREQIEEALANYAARACEKLRQQQSKAQGIYVFLRTNPFRQTHPQYQNGQTLGFVHPTSDTAFIIHHAKKLLTSLYRTGYQYQKCGIMLLDLVPQEIKQDNLFINDTPARTDHLMGVIDSINQSMGSQTIFHAAQGIHRRWHMRCDHRSKRYTTQWSELPEVF